MSASVSASEPLAATLPSVSPAPAGSTAPPIRIGLDIGARWTTLCALVPDGAGAPRLVQVAAPTQREPLTLTGAGPGGIYGLLGLASPELTPARLAAHPLELTIATTAGARAVLRRTGGPIALVTTAGFEDLLFIARPRRTPGEFYALAPLGPLEPVLPAEPLILRERTFGVSGRLGADGTEVEPLTEEALAALRAQVAASGARAVAVALLHSTRNPAHEQAVAAALAPLGLPVSLSSAVWPHEGEHDRTLATVLDAYLVPLQAARLGGLCAPSPHAGADHPAGLRLRLMCSDGTARAAASTSPLYTLLGGAAASLLGARRLLSAQGVSRFLALAVGATQTTVARCDGGYALARDADDAARVLGSLPLPPGLSQRTFELGSASRYGATAAGTLCPLPPLRLHASDGTLTPDDAELSAGPTATLGDALCALSGISDDAHERSLQLAQAALALLGARLGLSAEETAAAIRDHAEARLVAALAAVSIDAGHDPAEYALLALGGLAPALAPRLCAAAGCARLLPAPEPRRVGALGALHAEVLRERRQPLRDDVSYAETTGTLGRTLHALAAAVRADLAGEGAPPQGPVLLRWEADLRYRGQVHPLTVSGEADAVLAAADPAALRPGLAARFAAQHEASCGFTLAAPVEILEVRVRGAFTPAA